MLKAVGVLSTFEPVKCFIVNPEGIQVPDDVPILDSHDVRNGCLGYLERAWVEDDSLMGWLVFNDRAGRRVYQLIERGELSGCSCRFDIARFTICDADGDVLEIEEAIERGPDDPDLVIVAERTILREISITAMPADRNACARAIGFDAECWRMIRQGEAELHRILHSDGGGVAGDMRSGVWRCVELPPRVICYGAPVTARALINSNPTTS